MKTSAEQQARDMLERMGIKRAQEFNDGRIVELTNLINKVALLEQERVKLEGQSKELQKLLDALGKELKTLNTNLWGKLQ